MLSPDLVRVHTTWPARAPQSFQLQSIQSERRRLQESSIDTSGVNFNAAIRIMSTLASISIAALSPNHLHHHNNGHRHHRRVKMAAARQPGEGPQRSLLAAAVIIACIMIQAHSVFTNSIGANGTVQNAPVGSMPTLSERAGNLNSRYLSAGSTASLAAATVAAAANQPANGGSSGGNSQSSHQHQHSQQQQHLAAANGHQQQQQQQQQQHLQPSAQTTAVQQQAPVATNSAVQYNSVAQQQQPVQVQASSQPPVMASTYAYNPTTGQYSSQADLNQQQANQFQLPAPQVVVSNPSQFGQFGSSAIPSPANFIAPAPYQTYQSPAQRQPSRPPLSHPFGFSAAQQQPGSASSRYHQAVYTRRNGLAPRPQLSQNYPNGAGLEDDGSGSGFSLQQQQQAGGISLADQLAASLGLHLDPSYSITGSGLPSPSNVYLQQQQNANHHQNPVVDFLSPPAPSGHLNALNSLPYLTQANSNHQHHNHLYAGGSNSAPSTGQLGSSANIGIGGSGGAASDQQCLAADGRHGTCYQASECIKRGGTPMGRCSGPLDLGAAQSINGGGPSSSVCCLFDVTCGQFAAERFVYFRNPGYPASSYDQSRMCRAKIGKLDKGVCQFRLDMLRFDIAKPTDGNCSQDMFVVSGQNENYVIPKICGFNDGQHYYVGVDESGVITLHMMMMGYYRRSFEILITQIPCRSDFGAPAHCLQYFIGTHGTLKSFNYDNDLDPSNSLATLSNNNNNQQAFVNYDLQQDGSSLMPPVGLQGNGNGLGSAPTAPYGLQILQRQQLQQMFTSPQLQGQNRFGSLSELASSGGNNYQFGGYPNDLDYTMCIRKESGFCSISYQLSRLGEQQAGGSLAPFAVGQSSAWPGHNETGSISTDCRDDYLLIGGVRLCSGQSNSLSSNLYDSSLYQGIGQAQFNGSSSFNGAAAAGGGSYQSLLQQQQQLQGQQNLLMQQLARLQQQQQQTGGNVSSVSPNNQLPFGTSGQGVGHNNNNLEQQQTALMQQLMLVQQHLGNLAAATSQQQQHQFNGFQSDLGVNPNELQGSIITDTTSGPFLLRFVSNNAKNARGFHIDYRQNPCK